MLTNLAIAFSKIKKFAITFVKTGIVHYPGIPPGPPVDGMYFGTRYFGDRYFGNRYFG